MKERLLELKEALGKKVITEKTFELSKTELDNLAKSVKRAKETLIKETKDVEKLDGKNLTSLFFSMIGKKEERKDKEKDEMTTAKNSLEFLETKFNLKTKEHQELLFEIRKIQKAETEYKTMLLAAEEIILSLNHNGSDGIILLNDKMAELKAEKQQLNNLLEILEKVKDEANQALYELEETESLGVFDLVTDNLAISLLKRNQLNTAKSQVEELKRTLENFQVALNETKFEQEFHRMTKLDNSWMLIDIFMDNVFTDWLVLNDIQNVLEKVRQLDSKLSILKSLLIKKQKQIEEDTSIQKKGKSKLLESFII